MPDIYTGSPDQVLQAFYDVLTATYLDNGETQSSLHHAIDAMHAAAPVERLTKPPDAQIEIVVQEDGLHNPEDCPFIRIVGVEGLDGPWEAWGTNDEGQMVLRLQTVSYLTQASVVSGDPSLETSLAHQSAQWIAVMHKAVTRTSPNGRGLRGHGGGAIVGATMRVGRGGVYAVDEDLGARAARIPLIWIVTLNSHY